MDEKKSGLNSIAEKFANHFKKQQHAGSSRSSESFIDEERRVANGKQPVSSAASTSSNHTVTNATKANVFLESPVSVVLLVLLVVEAVAIVIMQSFVIFYHSSMFAQCQLTLVAIGLSQVDLIYHGLFAVTPIYQIFLYLDALRQKNTMNLLNLILFGILFIIFAGLQTIQHMSFEKAGCDFSMVDGYNNSTLIVSNNSTANSTAISEKLKTFAIIRNETSSEVYFQDTFDDLLSNMKPFEYAILVLVPITFLFMVAGIIFLYRRFKWNTHASHIIGCPNEDTSSTYKNVLIAWSTLTSLLKLDFFFFLAYSVQLIPSAMVGYYVPAYEGLLIFCVSLTIFSIAMHSANTENAKLLSLFCLALLGFIGYFGYRLFSFGIHKDGSNQDPYALTRYSLVFVTLTNVLLVIMTLGTSLICIRYVWLKKLRIIGHFPCACPTCFYGNDNPSAKDGNSTTAVNALCATCSRKTNEEPPKDKSVES